MTTNQPDEEVKWPVFAVKTTDGGLYWLDLEWGNRHGTGEGWLCVVPWGEQRSNRGFGGDNRRTVDHIDVVYFTRLDEEELCPNLAIMIDA